MIPETQRQVVKTIEAAEQIHFNPQVCDSIGGGDINSAFLVQDADRRYFVKVNHARYQKMMSAERDSLNHLRRADALRLPRPVAVGSAGDEAFLVLEYVPMCSRGDDRKLAQGLVRLHQALSPDGQFGWHNDNFIGTSPQYNRWHKDWPSFWLEQRLQPQLEMAYKGGHAAALKPLADALQERLPDLWGDYSPLASLLHGDLWGGNAAFLVSGEPIVYDPASYYGDRETDLALTRLFGGFSQRFYQEYERLWPLERGHERRLRLYNLYHLLNHLNLFGGGYLGQCRTIIQSLL